MVLQAGYEAALSGRGHHQPWAVQQVLALHQVGAVSGCLGVRAPLGVNCETLGLLYAAASCTCAGLWHNRARPS